MKSSADARKLLKELEYLFENYSNEYRANTQPYNYIKVKRKFKDYEYHPDDDVIRESLLEHIGSLPIIAVAMYPYIDDPDVDLGQALVMLAIHDIGEVVTGDENIFTKDPKGKVLERDAALKLLHKSFHETFDEVEDQKSRTAKFAKAVDKIAPDIFDYLTSAEHTVFRFKENVGIESDEIIPLITRYKTPYMKWNPFMTEFHAILMQEIDKKLKANSIASD